MDKKPNNYEIIYKKKEYDNIVLFNAYHRINENVKKECLLEKIKIRAEEEMNQISEEINLLKSLNSKYLFKILDYSIEYENNDKFVYILFDYYIYNYYNLDYFFHSNLNQIWTIFIKIIFALKELDSNKININELFPNNILFGNNVKITGIMKILYLKKKQIITIIITQNLKMAQ